MPFSDEVNEILKQLTSRLEFSDEHKDRQTKYDEELDNEKSTPAGMTDYDMIATDKKEHIYANKRREIRCLLDDDKGFMKLYKQKKVLEDELYPINYKISLLEKAMKSIVKPVKPIKTRFGFNKEYDENLMKYNKAVSYYQKEIDKKKPEQYELEDAIKALEELNEIYSYDNNHNKEKNCNINPLQRLKKLDRQEIKPDEEESKPDGQGIKLGEEENKTDKQESKLGEEENKTDEQESNPDEQKSNPDEQERIPYYIYGGKRKSYRNKKNKKTKKQKTNKRNRQKGNKKQTKRKQKNRQKE